MRSVTWFFIKTSENLLLHLNFSSKTWNNNLRDSSRLLTDLVNSQSNPTTNSFLCVCVCVELEEVSTIRRHTYLTPTISKAHHHHLDFKLKFESHNSQVPSFPDSVPPAISHLFNWVPTSIQKHEEFNNTKNHNRIKIRHRTYYDSVEICRLVKRGD